MWGPSMAREVQILKLPKLQNVTSFQHFDPGKGTDLALALGNFANDLGYPEAGDDWYQVASAIAQQRSPPNQILEARVTKACRSLAAALGKHADVVDANTEAQALAVERAKENASGKNKPGGPADKKSGLN